VFKVANLDGGPFFDAERLEQWAKNLVEEHTGNAETMMLIKNEDVSEHNKNKRSCRV